MRKNNTNNTEYDELIDGLLDLPVNNLESRIQELEKELKIRKVILNEALSSLGTHQLRLEDKINRQKYMLGLEANKTNLLKEIARTEIRKADELISYFRDVFQLKERLQAAKEELAKERKKQKLVKD